MRYGIISDIHSNIEALRAVIEMLRENSIDTIVCLGDIVGYGADPGECIDEVAQQVDFSLLGNHDSAVIGWENTDRFNQMARTAISWTIDRLGARQLEYLRNLEYTGYIGDAAFCAHASPQKPESWRYIASHKGVKEQFRAFESQVCFVGHTHNPLIYEFQNGNIDTSRKEICKLSKNTKYIINAGSVGQPRDKDPRACYLVYDEDERIVETRRVPYDIGAARDKILQARLPSHLAHRLTWGD